MALSLLLPVSCPSCGAEGGAPCASCWRRLRVAPPGPPPAGVDAMRSLLVYDGAGRELVARLKYRNARAVVGWLAAAMAALVHDWLPVGLVTWAPTTAARRRARGFDQAELLARAVAARLHVPARPMLVRAHGPPQTGRPRAERVSGVVFHALAGRWRAPPAAPSSPGAGGRVLLVDDVCTTGATLAAAASALRALCADEAGSDITVMSVTAARTPLKLREGSADA